MTRFMVILGLCLGLGLAAPAVALAASPSPSPSPSGLITPVPSEHPEKKPHCGHGQVLAGSFCVERHEHPVRKPASTAGQTAELPFTGFPAGWAAVLALGLIVAGFGLLQSAKQP